MILKINLSGEWSGNGVSAPLWEALAHVFENSGGSVSQCRKLTYWAAELREVRELQIDEVDLKDIVMPALEKSDLKAPIKVALADALDGKGSDAAHGGSGVAREGADNGARGRARSPGAVPGRAGK